MVANMSDADAIDTELGFAETQPSEIVAITIEDSEGKPSNGKLKLPPASVVVAMETKAR